ncbi:protein MLP1 homolog isoform X1 [Nylanderia fulva]|uniref:protein MLP1 homolog isoform X1 n=1 Tax=Nylanderia fulva TaxID=613905 RepID=UPI0010FAFF78|nr:protein MLP1 homolog isoform X1 [Nylanderia fulva]
MGGYAWVTLATNDAYSLGALVLAHSLRRVGTKYELACLITPGVTEPMREKLAAVFSLVQEVNVLDSKDEANLALLARPELGITFTKLHCWRLTQYEKCVFIDADALVVRNCDELFEREELSAAPDVGWPDCFNSGVFVFRPSQQTFASITAFAAAKGSFDGGDQGLLNMYFSDWASKDISKHLPFIYNMCSTATYSYLPAFKQFGEDVRIIHFIGITKPWLQYFDTLTGVVQPPSGSTHLQPLLQLWWNIFCEQVHPQLSPSMATSTLAPIWHAFASSSYLHPVPDISVYYDARNDVVSRKTPDFSEFKDPWEEYSPQNDSLPTDNSNKNENYYYAAEHEREIADVDRQNDGNISQQHNQQFHYEQHFSHAPAQMQYSSHPNNEHNQHLEHATSHYEENDSQRQFVQSTEHHWQQYSSDQRHQPVEQRHHPEHCHNGQHYHEHHHKRHHHSKHSEHHHSGQLQQHDYYKTDDHHIQHQPVQQQSHSNETWYENRAQQASDQTARADHHNHNDFHPQHHIQNNSTQDNFTSHYQSNEKNSEQSETTNKQTDAQRIDLHPSSPAPCTDLHNVAMRTDSNITEHLDNANTGIAGALAQLTLGEARSVEQIALEEHMRKQSWEQGQIDYMGRDSFDNIWKKICETLSLSPQRQPTPPKEETTEPKKSDTTAESAEPVKSAELIKSAEPAESAELKTVAPVDVKVNEPVVEAVKDPTQSLEAPEEKLSVAETASGISDESVIIAQSSEQKAPASSSEESVTAKIAAAEVPSEPIQPAATPTEAKSSETSTELPSTQELTPEGKSESLPVKTQQTDLQASTCLLADAASKGEEITPVTQTAEVETPASATQDATQPLASTLISVDSPQSIAASPIETAKPVTEPDIMQPLTIDPSEQHAEVLLAASEISTVSPVPIQVAESVLQAEPKESLSGTAINDEAIATTVTAVHESTNVAPAAITVEPTQLNGSVCEKRDDLVPAVSERTDASALQQTKEAASDLVITKDVPSEAPSATIKKVESVSSVVPPETSSEEEKKAEPVEEQTERPVVVPEAKSTEQIVKTETSELTEQPEQAEIMEEIARKSSSEISETLEIAESSSAEESEAKKALDIPSTPTVIEATPPTSPSVESTQEAEERQEARKKSLKKSDSPPDGTEGEGADKKAKKTVKKVPKKPKTKSEETTPSAESATAADTSQGKVTKKTVKVTKKIAKTGQTLETDTSVPETPPPPASAASSDAPVPPKRKTKSSISAKGTTSGKKPEAEE